MSSYYFVLSYIVPLALFMPETVETPSPGHPESVKTPSGIAPKKIRVIGVPLDLGQPRRGVDMGPSAVRVAGLEARLEAIGHKVEDGSNRAVGVAEHQKE